MVLTPYGVSAILDGVDVDAPEEFFDWLDRTEAKAQSGDDRARRLNCWFPPDRTTVIIALFGAHKAGMGDVVYASVGARADAAIRQWIYQTREEDSS